MTLLLIRHCEKPGSAWESATKQSRALRYLFELEIEFSVQILTLEFCVFPIILLTVE